MNPTAYEFKPLGEEIEAATVGHVGPMAERYVDDGIPFLRSQNIKPNAISFSDVKFIDEKFHSELRKSSLKVGDVVVVRTGYPGTAAVVTADMLPMNCADLVIITPGERVDSRYLASLLNSNFGKALVSGNTVGAAQQHFNVTTAKRIKVPLPSPPVQRKIAATLTAYDDLIENNRQRIALLERMAEEIYREWFVRLRFPGHEHTPVHKGVPEGWAIKLGEDLFETVKGRSYSSDEISDSPTGRDEEHPFITLKSIDRGGGYRREGLKFYRGRFNDNQIVAPGDVVMAVTDMTQNRAIVGQAGRIPDSPQCADAVISLDLVCLRPTEWSRTFLYSFCRYSGFASHLAQFANGANVLHLKPSVIGNQRLPTPPTDLTEKFDSIVEPMQQLVDSLSEQTVELANTRALLLKRFISGKLRVDDLDIQFPPSMQENAA